MGNLIPSALTALLAKQDIATGVFDPNTAKFSKQQRYFQLVRGINIYSYSTFQNLHRCERYLQLSKLEQNRTVIIQPPEENVDFAFGRAIESGVQSAFLGKEKHQIWFDMFMAWNMSLDTIHPKGYAKTFTDAVIAIDQFLYIKTQLFNEWELAYFNGKPAIELALCMDLENGYWYLGHADIILYNPLSGEYRVLEIKTTARTFLDAAMYKNSDQALGYSVFLDSVAQDKERTATFEVFYLVFATPKSTWTIFNFTKTRSARAGWINTILLDIQRINIYKAAGYWPKRGGSCFDYNRACKYFDSCDLDANHFNETGDFAYVGEEELSKHQFDFRFKLSEIIATQQELI